MEATSDVFLLVSIAAALVCASTWAYRAKCILLPAIASTLCISLAVAISFQFSTEAFWWPIASIFSLIWSGFVSLILALVAVVLRKRRDRIARERFEALAAKGNVPEATKILDGLGYDGDN